MKSAKCSESPGFMRLNSLMNFGGTMRCPRLTGQERSFIPDLR